MGVNRNTATKVVSVSMALIAAQAMVTAFKDTDRTFAYARSSKLDADTQKKVDFVVAQEMTRREISGAMELIASRFGDDERTIAQKYFPDGAIQLAQAVKKSDDFSLDSGVVKPEDFVGCYGNCYSNCHDACHGSRGWR